MSTLPLFLVNLHENLATSRTEESAWTIINEYFRSFELQDVQQELWTLTAGALGNNDIQQFQKGIERSNLIFFYEYTRMFFEAVDILRKKKEDVG
jgi:hypothetical protein